MTEQETAIAERLEQIIVEFGVTWKQVVRVAYLRYDPNREASSYASRPMAPATLQHEQARRIASPAQVIQLGPPTRKS